MAFKELISGIKGKSCTMLLIKPLIFKARDNFEVIVSADKFQKFEKNYSGIIFL
jgi:hypothetical protein